MKATGWCEVCGAGFGYEYRGGYRRRWCDDHADAGRRRRDVEYSRAWRRENREYTRAYAKSRYYADKAATLARVARRRAVKAGVPTTAVDREALYARDGGRCYLCMKPVPRDGWHMEHIIPLHAGGGHTWGNLAVSCPSCNLSKGVNHLRHFGVGVVESPTESTPPRLVRFTAPAPPRERIDHE